MNGGKRISVRKHMKTLDKEYPKIYLQATGEEDNMKMKSQKKRERERERKRNVKMAGARAAHLLS